MRHASPKWAASRPLRWKELLLAAAFVAGGLVGACGNDTLHCGIGTELVDGICVSTMVEIDCGEGTRLDEARNECVPLIECGPGSHFDPVQGLCLPDAVCGAGTTHNPTTGQCESEVLCGADTAYNPTTGECEPSRICGAYTELVDGWCLPIDRCGEGTTFDPGSGTCIADRVCGRGLVEVGGFCYTPAEAAALETDARESFTDDNDPLLGGEPEPVALEPIGERLVFTGTIGRPADRDGDGVVDQDRDVWSFAGRAGQLLRIQILDDGLPQPLFLLEGPEGYLRSSASGGALYADRRVILPYDGIYRLLIEPAAHRAGGFLIGGIGYGYVGIVEEVPWPSTRALTPAPPPAVGRVSGRVLDFRNNFIALTVDTAAAVFARGEAFGTSTEPVLMAFAENGIFLGETRFELSAGGWQATLNAIAEPSNRTVLFVDWVFSDGVDVDYQLAVSQLPAARLPDLAEDSELHLPRAVVPAQRFAAFAFTGQAGQVVTAQVDGLSSGPLSLFGPRGLIEDRIALRHGAYSFFVEQTGTCTLVYANDGIRDARVSIGLFSATPVSLETANGVDVLIDSASSTDLMPRRRLFDTFWVLAANSGPVLFEAELEYGFGSPELSGHRIGPTGRLQQSRLVGPKDPATLHLVAEDPGRSLFALSGGSVAPANPAVRDWALQLSRFPVAALSEQEPNDAPPYLVDHLGPPPLFATGHIGPGEVDVLEFMMPEPLSLGEGLRVEVENLDGGAAPGMVIRDAVLARVHGTSETLGRFANAWTLFPHDGSLATGPFFLEITSALVDANYLVHLKRVVVDAEREPNQPVDRPMPLGVLNTLPLRLAGNTRVGATDADNFSFTAPFDIPAGSALLIRAGLTAVNGPAGSEGALNLLLSDHLGNPVAQSQGRQAALLPELTPGILYTLTVSGTTTWENQYDLLFELLAGVESETNDSLFVANLVPDLSAGDRRSVIGIERYLGTDVFRVALPVDQPLGVNEAVSVSWHGFLGQTTLDVSILRADGTVMGANRGRFGEVVVGPPGLAGPAYYVKVVPMSSVATARPEIYQLDFDRVVATPEVEPNNDRASAQLLDAPPIWLRAMSRGLGSGEADPDIFSFALPRTLNSNERLHVRATTVYSLDDIRVTIRDASFVEVANGADADLEMVVELPNRDAGSLYFLEFLSARARGGEFSVYDATIELVQQP